MLDGQIRFMARQFLLMEMCLPLLELSQLVFVVGHVAIKHLVYLELIERELKRRKDVDAKG